jgi:hypothetical protein
MELTTMSPRVAGGLALLFFIFALLWFKASTAWFFALFL